MEIGLKAPVHGPWLSAEEAAANPEGAESKTLPAMPGSRRGINRPRVWGPPTSCVHTTASSSVTTPQVRPVSQMKEKGTEKSPNTQEDTKLPEFF